MVDLAPHPAQPPTSSPYQPILEAKDAWRSAATRHLSVAAYVDPRFRRTVLTEVYDHPRRAVAPSYGFDAVPVLHHCRRAQVLDVLRDGAFLAFGGVFLVTAPVQFAALVSLVIWLYLITGFIQLVVETVRLIRDRAPVGAYGRLAIRAALLFLAGLFASVLAPLLLAPFLLGAAGSALTGSPAPLFSAPLVLFGLGAVMVIGIGASVARQKALDRIAAGDPSWTNGLTHRLREIGLQQYAPVTRYAGFRPFIGSGVELNTWSFVQRLMPTDRSGPETTLEVEKFPTPFSSVELVDHLRQRLDGFRGNPEPTQRLSDCVVTEHVFVSGRHPFLFPRNTVDPSARTELITNPDGPARHALACQVSSWGGEIVATVYLHASVQGGMLYLELSTWALPPTRREYQVIDEIGGTGPAAMAHAVWTGLRDLGVNLLLAPARLVLAGYDSLRAALADQGPVAGEVALLSTSAGLDTGARLSIREAGTAGLTDNYFQLRDVIKFGKLVERRILSDVNDFLDLHGVDVAEYRQRTVAVLNQNIHNNINNGIQNSGPGSVHATDVAMGINTSRTGGASK